MKPCPRCDAEARLAEVYPPAVLYQFDLSEIPIFWTVECRACRFRFGRYFEDPAEAVQYWEATVYTK